MRVISSLRQVLAKPEEAEPQLDTRAVSHSGLSPLELRSVDAFVHAVNVYAHRQAVDVDEMQLRAEWVESPQAVPNRVVDLERQVAQLHGPLVSLLRLPRDLWPRHLLLTSLPWIRHCMPTRL
ncbi:hypothetical protein PC120_g10206 [Phytophthora cactorum]|nr:hypothetical protein PC120_g10206 [Phytophthora cactorum]